MHETLKYSRTRAIVTRKQWNNPPKSRSQFSIEEIKLKKTLVPCK